MKTPFHRSAAMFALIAAAMAAPNAQQALASIGQYKSRGHGRSVYSGIKKSTSSSGKYTGVFNGEREVMRRRRQIERGIIKAVG